MWKIEQQFQSIKESLKNFMTCTTDDIYIFVVRGFYLFGLYDSIFVLYYNVFGLHDDVF